MIVKTQEEAAARAKAARDVPDDQRRCILSQSQYRRKPWRVDWFEPEIEHRKYTKAFMQDEDYSESVTLYFGDLHKHTSLSPCANVDPWNGSCAESYEYARDVARTDFLAIADHAEHLTEEQWRECMALARQHTEPGRFVAWPAVEWAVGLYGHRNIYWKGYDVPLISGKTHGTPPKLWAALHAESTPALTIPHHAARELACDMTRTDPELEPAYEIYSGWGNEEYWGAPKQDTDRSYTRNFYVDTLLRGFKMGVVGGGDGHPAKPAICALTGVYARDLTLDSLFEALRQRRTIATTGAKIRLDFHINGLPMGTAVSFNQHQIDELFPLEIGVAVQGTAPIEKVEIIENGCVIHTKAKPRAAAEMFAYRWWRGARPTDGVHPIGAPTNVSRFVYVRVTQSDGHMAWCSPIWLDFVYDE